MTRFVTCLFAVLAVAACNKTTPEPEPSEKGNGSSTSPSGPAKKNGDDPLNGSFSLADATKDLPGSGAIVAKLETTGGTLQCKLYDDKAPITVANFIGLATGKRTWKDPSGNWVNKPAYDGTFFHRIIKGFMIQGGDPTGTGRGGSSIWGRKFEDEFVPSLRHDSKGTLSMANSGPGTNGSQFFITLGPTPHLNGKHTVFGKVVQGEDVVDKLGSVKTASGDRPVSEVKINSATVF